LRPENIQGPLPTCTTLAEIRAVDRQPARLIGLYRATALVQGTKSRGARPDRAVVALRDGTEVLLEPNWSAASQRPAAELEQFDNRRVAVEGVVHADSPAPAESVAYITGPCVSPVWTIEALPEEGNA